MRKGHEGERKGKRKELKKRGGGSEEGTHVKGGKEEMKEVKEGGMVGRKGGRKGRRWVARGEGSKGGRKAGREQCFHLHFFFRVMSLLHACLPKSYNFQA